MSCSASTSLVAVADHARQPRGVKEPELREDEREIVARAVEWMAKKGVSSQRLAAEALSKYGLGRFKQQTIGTAIVSRDVSVRLREAVIACLADVGVIRDADFESLEEVFGDRPRRWTREELEREIKLHGSEQMRIAFALLRKDHAEIPLSTLARAFLRPRFTRRYLDRKSPWWVNEVQQLWHDEQRRALIPPERLPEIVRDLTG